MGGLATPILLRWYFRNLERHIVQSFQREPASTARLQLGTLHGRVAPGGGAGDWEDLLNLKPDGMRMRIFRPVDLLRFRDKTYSMAHKQSHLPFYGTY